MSEGHARLGPSNNRWPNCPGSVREEAAYPDVPGAAAIDGTGSHLLLEMCLENGVRADAYDMQIIGTNHPDNINGWLVARDRVDRVQECLDYVERRVKELHGQFPGSTIKVEAESKSDPGGMFGRTDWWGTVDITITVTNKHGCCLFIEVIDYKDGRGYVSEKDNTQLLSYLVGKMRPFIASGRDLVRPFRPDAVQSCRVTIVQPKTNPSVRFDEPATESVIARAEELSLAAVATEKPDAPLVPDNKGGKGWCQWCKHKPNCTAHNGTGIKAVKIMTNIQTDNSKPLFELLESAVSDISNMEDLQLADLADTEATVQSIYDKIKTEIESRVTQGHHVPGYAMQPGRGSNKWNKPEEEIVKMLKARRLKKEQIYPPSLISPAQVMKLDCLDDAQKERISKEHISYVVGKNKLTKVAREKKATSTAEELFADVTNKTFDNRQTVKIESDSPVSFM